MAANPMQQPQQNKADDAKPFRSAPARANLTNARTGMVNPKHYADGTSNVKPSTPSKSSNPVADAVNSVSPPGVAVRGLTGLFDSALKSAVEPPPPRHYADGTADVPAGPGAILGGYGRGPASFGMTGSTPLVQIPSAQEAAALHAALPQPSAAVAVPAITAGPAVPLSVPHAQSMFDAAIAAPATSLAHPVSHPPIDMRYAENAQAARLQAEGKPFIKAIGGEFTPNDPGYDPKAVYAPGTPGAPVGTAIHAVANPEHYTPEGFHAATHGMSLDHLMSLYQQSQYAMHAGQAQAARDFDPHTQLITQLLANAAPADRPLLAKQYLGMVMKTFEQAQPAEEQR